MLLQTKLCIPCKLRMLHHDKHWPQDLGHKHIQECLQDLLRRLVLNKQEDLVITEGVKKHSLCSFECQTRTNCKHASRFLFLHILYMVQSAHTERLCAITIQISGIPRILYGKLMAGIVLRLNLSKYLSFEKYLSSQIRSFYNWNV